MALAIRAVALSAEALSQVPDNYQMAVESGKFDAAHDFDRKRNYLPPRILSADDEWQELDFFQARRSEDVERRYVFLHMRAFQGRSYFRVFCRFPGGRTQFEKYLQDLDANGIDWRASAQHGAISLKPGAPELPAGTEVALLQFLIALDAELGLVRVGSRWSGMPSAPIAGERFFDQFVIDRPNDLHDAAGIEANQANIVVLSQRVRPEFKLRGQFVVLPSPRGRVRYLFVGGPWITRLADLATFGIEFSDFPPHDPRGDFLVLFQTQEASLADMRNLTSRLRATATSLAARTTEMEHEMARREKLEIGRASCRERV